MIGIQSADPGTHLTWERPDCGRFAYRPRSVRFARGVLQRELQELDGIGDCRFVNAAQHFGAVVAAETELVADPLRLRDNWRIGFFSSLARRMTDFPVRSATSRRP